MKKILGIIFVLFVFGCARPPTILETYNQEVNSIVYITNIEDAGHGTGFYIGNDMIVTCKHVAEGVNGVLYAVTYNGNGVKMNMEVKYISKDVDFAILTLKHEHGLVPLKFAEKNANIGDRVHVIGHPADKKLQFSYSEGYVMKEKFEDLELVSGWSVQKFAGENFLYSVDRFWGSSGSPVLNEQNEVVGLLNALLPHSTIAFGLTVEQMKAEMVKM